MRAHYKTGWKGAVLIAYDHKCYDGSVQRIERVFSCPHLGGFVREHDIPSNGMKQAYVGLAENGFALHCARREYLRDCIRREYRALRHAEKREARLEGGVK